jgi:hypothetical protein
MELEEGSENYGKVIGIIVIILTLLSLFSLVNIFKKAQENALTGHVAEEQIKPSSYMAFYSFMLTIVVLIAIVSTVLISTMRNRKRYG